MFGYKLKKKQMLDLNEELNFHVSQLCTRKVCRVLKGGRKFSFTSLVIVGNKAGYIGIGSGNASDALTAKNKAIKNAKNNMYFIYMNKDKTLSHPVLGRYGSSRVFLRPASTGTGLILGGVVKSVLSSVGFTDAVGKAMQSRNPYNLSMAVINALLKLVSVDYVNKLK